MIDFKDFIRLSEFLDSTVFKLSKDTSPARSITSMGITIEPTILERMKGSEIITNTTFKHHAPVSLNLNPDVSENRGKYYSWLQGDKSAFITGKISGSVVTYYDDFQLMNENKYARNTSFTSDDTYAFNHSGYSALLNNVSKQKGSSTYKKIEYLYPAYNGTSYTRGINEYVTSSVSFQDSYLNSTFYLNSRYNGSKNIDSGSLLPNSISGSLKILGNKIGVFNNFKKDNFLPGKTVLELRYLSDESGSLSVLNSRNKNLGDIQKIFKPGDKLSLGYFRTGQTKINKRAIYETGYSYRPVLYFASSSDSTKHDSALNFEYINGFRPDDIESTNGNVSISIASGITKVAGFYPDYQSTFTNGTNIPIYGVFDYHKLVGESNANGGYVNSNYGLLTKNKFTATATTQYTVSSKFSIEPVFLSGGEVSYSVKIYKNGSATPLENISQTAKNISEVNFYVYSVPESDILGILNEFIQSDVGSQNSSGTSPSYSVSNIWSGIESKYYTKVNIYGVNQYSLDRTGLIETLENKKNSSSFRLERSRMLYSYNNMNGYFSEVTIERQSLYNNLAENSEPLYVSYTMVPYTQYYQGAKNNLFPDYTVSGIDEGNSNQQLSFSFDINKSIQLTKGEYLEFELSKNIASGTMQYERILSGNFSIKGTSSVQSVGITISPSNNTIAFSNGLSFVYGSTRFVPFSTPTDNNINSKAWSEFGAVSEDFIINNNSFALFVYTPKTTTNGQTGIKRQLVRIKSIQHSDLDSSWVMKVDSIPADLAYEIITNKVDYKVCFLSRFNDETSIILNYAYTDNDFGSTTTSNAGFLIPSNYNPALEDNLDSVVSSIKNSTNLITNI